MNDTLHIVCPHCAATNRVSAARLGQGPKCGQCKQALFTGAPLAVTGETFQKHITSNGIPTLVDFWAPWCGPCRMMAPVYAQAAARLEPQVRLLKLDTEAEQATAARFSIRSIPTLILFRHGHEQSRQAGALDLGNLLRWVQTQL